jgi:hypothetical protein
MGRAKCIVGVVGAGPGRRRRAISRFCRAISRLCNVPWELDRYEEDGRRITWEGSERVRLMYATASVVDRDGLFVYVDDSCKYALSADATEISWTAFTSAYAVPTPLPWKQGSLNRDLDFARALTHTDRVRNNGGALQLSSSETGQSYRLERRPDELPAEPTTSRRRAPVSWSAVGGGRRTLAEGRASPGAVHAAR